MLVTEVGADYTPGSGAGLEGDDCEFPLKDRWMAAGTSSRPGVSPV